MTEKLSRSETLVVPSGGRMSYSQSGEDVIVDYIFRLRSIGMPTYLDIGANHPWDLSNTAMFYLRGCRGINVEPNPVLHRLFEQERPQDINQNVGIGVQSGRLPLFVMEDPALSTFSVETKDELLAYGHRLLETREVELRTIREILALHSKTGFADFLNVDVEGYEEEVLGQIDYQRNAPKVICLETAEYSPTGSGEKRTDLIKLVCDRGFEIYADTNLNTIFVRSDFWRGQSRD